ncbi:MAG: hypothetical protein HS107_10070 [Thermoflexaceae bacterium]|nr:hypothetical protein [Thermoflexaceae bacterium]
MNGDPRGLLVECGFEPAALELLSTPDGRPVVEDPGTGFANAESTQRPPYGFGPFCRFKVPSAPASAGVYAFVVDEVLVYAGISANRRHRLNQEYGRISPRNCFEGGPRTTCRVNSLLCRAAMAGIWITLLLKQTPGPRELERVLITSLRPAWNLQRSTA